MAMVLRVLLWMAWVVGIGWLWRTGALASGVALVAFVAGSALAAWRAGPTRRRRSALRYVEMSKQPVA